jgi:hypothetical protein
LRTYKIFPLKDFICPFKIIISPEGMKVKTPGTGETAHQVQGIQINSGNQ